MKMKTFISALISCSLTLGAIAMAQQDQEQQKSKKKKSEQTSEAQPQATAAAQGQQAGGQHGKGMGKAGAAHKERTATTAATPMTTGQANVNATEGTGKHKGKRGGATQATSPAATENANVNATTQEAGKHKGKHAEAAMKTASPGPGTAAAGAAGGKASKAGNVGKNGKQVNVQQIKGQHTNFHAQAQPQKVKSVTFNQNYRIVGAQNWAGPQYEVFRAYTPVWHDAGWYRSSFARVELIGGGYYYFNNGYWYPAWGYDPATQYYPYDGPIYVGARAEPPDQVIADVQAALKDMGYYTGEVDGLLGPLTREALTAYQSDHGLYATATIDEPTLDTLGLG
jgi:Putative peptidoglycan binding domain